MLWYHLPTGRISWNLNHVRDGREPIYGSEIYNCWNCNGDGIIENLNAELGYNLGGCPVCDGEQEMHFSIERFPQEGDVENLAGLGLLRFHSWENNLPAI